MGKWGAGKSLVVGWDMTSQNMGKKHLRWMKPPELMLLHGK